MQLDDAATILSHADFFEVCDAEQRRLLAFASERKKYRPGSIIYKSGDVPATSRPKVVLDVVYAKEPPDPSYLSAKESYEALNGELNAEAIAPDAKAAAEQEARAGCGQPT